MVCCWCHICIVLQNDVADMCFSPIGIQIAILIFPNIQPKITITKVNMLVEHEMAVNAYQAGCTSFCLFPFMQITMDVHGRVLFMCPSVGPHARHDDIYFVFPDV